MLKTRLERVGDFEVLAAEDSEEGCRLAAIHPAAGQDRAPPGKHTVNTDPLPGSLVTVTSPPIAQLARDGEAEARAAKSLRRRLLKPWPSVLTPRSTVSATREPLY